MYNKITRNYLDHFPKITLFFIGVKIGDLKIGDLV